MNSYRKTRSPIRKIIRRILIILIALFLIAWMVGFQNIRNQWNFLRFGGGSVKKIDEFYKAASAKDSTAFLSLFSEKTLQKEGRQNILNAFQWGSYKKYSRENPFSTEIKSKRMKGDTAMIRVNVTRDYSQNEVTFCLLKENGNWKIVFPD